MDESQDTIDIKRLEKVVKVLEKKLSTCMEMRMNSDEIRNSQTILFEKVHKELDESRQVISQQNREIRSILQNIEQGILVVSEDLKVGDNRSAFIAAILGREPAHEERIDQYLFGNCSLSKDAVRTAMSAILTCANEPDFMFTCNCRQLPAEFVISAPGGDKIVEVDWNPILNDDRIVEKIIVALRDVTELRKLRQASVAKERSLKLVAEIIEHDFDDVVRFLDAALMTAKESAALIKSDERSTAALERLFRHAHTIKGNARSFRFDGIVDLAHHAEAFYEDVRTAASAWSRERMLADVQAMAEALASYSDVLATKLQHSRENRRSTFAPLSELLRTSIKALASIAAEIGKPAPEVAFTGAIQLHRDLSTLLMDVFNHCLRNSLDHGIDAPASRSARGKPPAGMITLGSELMGTILRLTIEDDGIGLDLGRLRQKAEILGLLPPGGGDDGAVSEAIFASGVSTREQVGNISGRGVGMDAVRAALEVRGGRIHVEFTGPRTSTGHRPFRLVIHLPVDGVDNVHLAIAAA